MGSVVGGLLGAIAGAALAAYVQKRRASERRDENEFRRTLAELEAEIEELEFNLRGRKGRLESAPASQRAKPSAWPRPFPEVRGRASGAAVSGSYRRPKFQTKSYRLRFEPRNDGRL